LAESSKGRRAAQVAANIGMAAWAAQPMVQIGLADSGLVAAAGPAMTLLLAPAVAVLAEAAADTVSSEAGQVLGGTPRLITTLRRVQTGTDGAISLAGTLAGIASAAIVAAAGAWALGGGWLFFTVACAGGVFGLFFDSLLGATLERKGWLNNDMVNFLSTIGAALAALLLLALLPGTAAG
ncbi:MAG: DUF92 domain-containing protein, partial [Terracidiphilus sp.]